jgi:opacity protein-like surface antigen
MEPSRLIQRAARSRLKVDLPMGMKSLRILFCLLLLSAPLFSQSRETSRTAATAPGIEASLGYLYMIMSQPFSTHVALAGVDANGIVQFSPRWGAMADFSVAHVANVLRTPHSDNVFSGLVGPVFFPLQRGRTSVFVHALGGLAWVDSAVPVSNTAYFSGWETRFSYALGGGVEYAVTGPFSVRLGADYQRTTFVNQNLGLQNQNNIRLTTGIAYRFGSR